MFPAFDEHVLARRLQPLPWFLAVAFGAAAVNRLVSNFQRFIDETGRGDIQPIIRALDLLWRVATTQVPPPDDECRSLAAACEIQAPDSDEFGSLYTSSAQDAVFAVCSLLDFCVSRKSEQLVLAARYPTDSIDLYVQEIERLSPQDPALESKIQAHPLMQQELRRQERDIFALESSGAQAIHQLLSRRTVEEVFRLLPDE